VLGWKNQQQNPQGLPQQSPWWQAQQLHRAQQQQQQQQQPTTRTYPVSGSVVFWYCFSQGLMGMLSVWLFSQGASHCKWDALSPEETGGATEGKPAMRASTPSMQKWAPKNAYRPLLK
jgi:hypothetical protein